MKHTITALRTVAVLFALLAALTGCGTVGPAADTGFDRLASDLGDLPGVSTAKVSGSYNGLPTSRNLDLSITVTDASTLDLTAFTGSVLREAWTFDVYQPSHVAISLLDASDPAPAGFEKQPVDLTDAALALGIADPTMTKNSLIVVDDDLSELYGAWPAPSSSPSP